MAANALVLLAEGAEEMETVIAVDVLRHVCIFFCTNTHPTVHIPKYHE